MNGIAVRIVAAAVGAGTAAIGGLAAGGWWWVAAGVGAVAAVGAMFDRQLAFALVLASLALVAGVLDADQGWLVAVIAAGTMTSIELAALADRMSVVRPRAPDVARVARTAPAVAVISLAVLVVGNVSDGGPSLAPLGAALAALVAIRVLAR